MHHPTWWTYFVLIIAALAGFVEGIPVPDSPNVIHCSKFAAPGECVEYTGYPTQINGIDVDFYRYVDNWTTPNPIGDTNSAAIGNALRTVLPIFSTFSPPFKITIVLVKALEDLAATTCVLPDGTPCYILIREQPNSGVDPSFNLEQTTVHELYHCIQWRNQGTKLPDITGSGWWIEGSAEYFANKFYQDNHPGSHIKSYDPNIVLYSQYKGERASIFFQFLSNQGWDDNDINGFVIQQIQDAQVGGSERTIMSSNADLQRLFPIFAQKYSGFAITFPDGNLAQGNPGTLINEIAISLNLQYDGQQQATSVDVQSFAMKTFTVTLQPGITYSIQWAPSGQDGKTVLAYQQTENISGNTAWTTFDPATPIHIPVDCSSGSVQYKFLLTSTADEDVSHGQLTVVRESSQSCGCKDLGILLDPCLSGNWNLDIDEFRAYLQGRMAELDGITVSNLAASGASTFELPTGNMGGMTFSALIINYDAAADGQSLHTTIELTGTVSGQVVMQAAGEFCWLEGQGQGQAHTTTTVAGLVDPIVIDVPLYTGYVAPTLNVGYTCSATSLQLEAYDNGQYAWALSYLKV